MKFIMNDLALSSTAVIKINECLATKTTLRVGGCVRYYVQPSNDTDLLTIMAYVKKQNIPYFVLGRGSNLLIKTEEFPGVAIHLIQPYWQNLERVDELRFWAAAGLRLKSLCGQAATWGLQGFEFLEGIPGCVGGALRMNAGAMGSWTFDVVEQVTFLTHEGEIKTVNKEALEINYRSCETLKTSIALGALFKAKNIMLTEDIKSCMEAFAHKRKSSQPRESSAGCMFKNPEGDYAGRLIESAGLKGYTIGGAQVSLIHANFVINTGHATTNDILALIQHIQDTVYRIHGVRLELEVQVIY